jgi:hypothetical protein
MTRAADVKVMRMDGTVGIIDLTPTPLTTVAPGEWKRVSGSQPGFVHIRAGGTSPVITFTVEASNDELSTTGVPIFGTTADPVTISGDLTSEGFVLYAGCAFVRINPLSFSGTGANLTATVAYP